MRGGIDHVMINCNDFEAAVRFYSWLMPKIGYPNSQLFGLFHRPKRYQARSRPLLINEASDRSEPGT